jgi:ribosome maturation factor RimP
VTRAEDEVGGDAHFLLPEAEAHTRLGHRHVAGRQRGGAPVDQQTVAARVRSAAEPVVAAAELDLVEVDVRGQAPRRVVRIIVDRKGGVDLQRCSALARELGDPLDALSDLDGRYVLEVTSPGVDYPLRDRRAFDRVEGRTVLVHRRDEDGRLHEVRGAVLAADPEEVVLEVEGSPVRVPYDEIAKATQSLPW